MPSALQTIERDHTLSIADTPSTVVERTCRVTLASDWPSAAKPRPIELRWRRDRFTRESLIILKPGATLEQPLNKCHSWFGPFDRFDEYEEAIRKGDDKIATVLREHIATEMARYLTRYDYPRGNGRGSNPDMTPIGPHRSPDVSIQVMDPEGNHGPVIRLYQKYGIGEYDDLNDTFRVPETEEQIKARYDEQLRAREREILETRREMAELKGMVKGLVVAGAVVEK